MWVFRAACLGLGRTRWAGAGSVMEALLATSASCEDEYEARVRLAHACAASLDLRPGPILAVHQRAVAALNSLQTNAAAREKMKHSGKPRKSFELPRMRRYLERVGVEVEDLNQLNVIHVAGTKGKGSVSAMCESILRCSGLKTGFYSSPHLLEVRERIRINGRPLTRAAFVTAFWRCHQQLATSHGERQDWPSYFRMLTVMAFHVFLMEKVDVAVVEVGIGGAFDSTNIVPQPVVCAVAALGYDHTDVLGTTLEQIAWQKAGICKPGRPLYTMPQPTCALHVLRDRAKELEASSVRVIPDLSDYPGDKPTLGLHGRHQLLNSSLAVQVCREWLVQMGRWRGGGVEGWRGVGGAADHDSSGVTVDGVMQARSFPLPQTFHHGLHDCRWAGRNQTVRGRREGVTFFLDGAHTPQSIKLSAEWFQDASRAEAKESSARVIRALLFNITHSRDPLTLLPSLLGCQFAYAVFCPNTASSDFPNSADHTNLTVTGEAEATAVEANRQAWLALCSQRPEAVDPAHSASHAHSFHSVHAAVTWLQSAAATPPSPAHIHLLVTGSLHLVGTVMQVLGYRPEDT